MAVRIGMGGPWLAAALLAVSGCTLGPAPSKLFVETRHAHDIAFERYRSYAWAAAAHARAGDAFGVYPELAPLISAAVDRQLAAKGFEKRAAGEADFLVSMRARVGDVTLVSRNRYDGWSHGYDRTAPASLGATTRLDKRVEGTLILEFVDVASEGVVWQSQAAGVVTRREGLEEAVDSAVARMLESFPPPS